jgi:hypothetical protein
MSEASAATRSNAYRLFCIWEATNTPEEFVKAAREHADFKLGYDALYMICLVFDMQHDAHFAEGDFAQ